MAEALRLLASDALKDRLQAAQLLARAYALDEEKRLAERSLAGDAADQDFGSLDGADCAADGDDPDEE